MARSRGPGNLVARRPTTEARTDTRAHADYDHMIDDDLGGRRQHSYRAVDDGRPVGAAELLRQPIALFLLACTAFVIVLVAWLWQAGIFGQLQFRFTPKEPAPSTAWMGGRESRGVRPVDTADRAPSAAAAPSAEPAAPDDDAATSTPENTTDNPGG